MRIMSTKFKTEFDSKEGGAEGPESIEIQAVYKDGELRQLTILNIGKRTEETYIRNSSPSRTEPYGTFIFTGLYPAREEERKKINPVSAGNGFKKALLTGEDPKEVEKLYGIVIRKERWHKVGVNFENGAPIYLDFETGKKEGLARDKETEKQKRGTRKLLRTASGRLTVDE